MIYLFDKCTIYISDSLLFGDCSEYNSKDVNCCFETQCNQIFLGMVTMQYQPQYDMVKMKGTNSFILVIYIYSK